MGLYCEPLCRRVALSATLLTSTVRVVPGASVFFNTDTGAMVVDGLAATTLNGTAVQSSILSTPAGQVMQFRFLGNLTLNSSDQVTAGGSRPLSLFAGDDVNVSAGTVLNFDADGLTGRLGGGSGGRVDRRR